MKTIISSMKKEWKEITCFLIFLTIAILCFSGFIKSQMPDKMKERIVVKNIVRVFMHEQNDYSVMRQVGEKMEINNLRKFTNGSILHSVVFREISLAEPMRVELTADQDGYLNATIYIHRPEDVTGGEWNHGKNGHGQTMVVR